MKDKLWVKILVPVLIVAVVAGIFMIKNSQKPKNAPENPQDTSVLTDDLKNADFSLRSTTAIDFEELSAYGLPIIVDYGADTCIPCKAMAPVLEKANTEFTGKAFVKFINVWDYPDAANNVPVQLIPTQVIFDASGKPFVPSDELAAKIEFTMYSDKNTNEHIFTVHQGGLIEEEMWAILAEMGVTPDD